MTRLLGLLPSLEYELCVLTGDYRGKNFGPSVPCRDGAAARGPERTCIRAGERMISGKRGERNNRECPRPVAESAGADSVGLPLSPRAFAPEGRLGKILRIQKKSLIWIKSTKSALATRGKLPPVKQAAERPSFPLAIRFPKPHAGTAAIFRDELDVGGFGRILNEAMIWLETREGADPRR
jgi:hypothetical protein